MSVRAQSIYYVPQLGACWKRLAMPNLHRRRLATLEELRSSVKSE